MSDISGRQLTKAELDAVGFGLSATRPSVQCRRQWQSGLLPSRMILQSAKRRPSRSRGRDHR